MNVNYLSGDGAFARFGDYSPLATATSPGKVVAIAGQFGTDRNGALADSGDAYDQTRHAFRNVGAALAEADLTFGDVLKFTTFVVGRDTIPAFMAVRKEVFAEIYPDGVYPPNTLLIVAGLVEERFRIEIEALAVGS